MSRPADGKLGAALAALTKALNASGLAWMCIGGIAVIAQGVRRTTTDIDVTFRAEGVDLDALLRRLVRHGIRPRIPDAATFARRSQVLLLEHTASGVELDVSLAWLSFEHEALAAPVTIDFAGVKAPAARAEDLIIYKLFAGRPQDLNDAEALLLMHRAEIDLARVRAVLAHLGEMADAPEIVGRLDAIDRARPRPPGRRPARTAVRKPRGS
ncbi:hypothetical protein BH11MYX4_BH11MYX4_21370 [soil metagenome]